MTANSNDPIHTSTTKSHTGFHQGGAACSGARFMLERTSLRETVTSFRVSERHCSFHANLAGGVRPPLAQSDYFPFGVTRTLRNATGP